MNILIRADSSSSIGTGHIMRDLVLAKQFTNDYVVFATQNLSHNINSKIIEVGYAIELLKSNEVKELDTLIKKLQIDMVVIDHYSIDYEFENQLKTNNPKLKIFVLEDTYERHCCDILLNHNISADESRYKNLVPENCELRCGSNYILLRDEFYDYKNMPKPENLTPKIFVAMGGADHSNINISILKVIEEIGGLYVNLVTTVANKKLDELKEYCLDKKWISLYINSNQIAKLMRLCDFAIVTPSVTANEVMFMGLPFIAIMTAENQSDIYEYLQKKEFMVVSGFNKEVLKNNVIRVIQEL